MKFFRNGFFMKSIRLILEDVYHFRTNNSGRYNKGYSRTLLFTVFYDFHTQIEIKCLTNQTSLIFRILQFLFERFDIFSPPSCLVKKISQKNVSTKIGLQLFNLFEQIYFFYKNAFQAILLISSFMHRSYGLSQQNLSA